MKKRKKKSKNATQGNIIKQNLVECARFLRSLNNHIHRSKMYVI